MVADLGAWLSEAWSDYQNTWAAADQELYELCRRRGHDTFIDVYTKVAFINRVYAAGITRAVASVDGKDGETLVATAFVELRAEVNASLSRLAASDGINLSTMGAIVEEHAKLTDALASRCGNVRLPSFVSKYLKGAKVPTGNTEFQFKVADLTFKSTSYDWLVIAGAKAKYKGTGTINGTGDYGFQLSAIDGQVSGGGGADKFRIKIWDKVTGQVVYDNQMTAPDDADPTTMLGGGSIVIHK